MSDPIAGGEQSIEELAARLVSSASHAATDVKEAADALLNAKPQPAPAAAPPPPTPAPPIPTPPIPTAAAPASASPPQPQQTSTVTPTQPATRNALVLTQHLDSLKATVPAAALAAVNAANATINLLQRPEVQQAASSDPQLAQQVASIIQRAHARIQNAQTLQTQFLNSLGPIQATLMKSAQL
jgi:hypothetical protein